MAEQKLKGKRIAILATDGFEHDELHKPLQALKDAGADVKIVSVNEGKIKSWKMKNWGEELDVDLPLNVANPEDFDGLVLPGGVINPDRLRMDDSAVAFVKAFGVDNKPIAAICHGPWTLIDAGLVDGKRVTSWPSLKTDLINAGAHWVDEEVVTDMGLVTSRKPADIPAFNRKMIEEFAEGPHKNRKPRATQVDSYPPIH